MSSWNRVVSRRLVHCVITVRYLHRGGKLRNTLLLEFSWVASKAAARGQPCCLYSNGEVNVRDWKFSQRWCSWSRSCGLCWEARLFVFRHFEGSCRLRIHHLGFISHWRRTQYLLSKRRQSTLLLRTEEPRGLIIMGNKSYKEVSSCTDCICIIHSFCSLLRQAHTFLQSQFSTGCHLVFPL